MIGRLDNRSPMTEIISHPRVGSGYNGSCKRKLIPVKLSFLTLKSLAGRIEIASGPNLARGSPFEEHWYKPLDYIDTEEV